MESNVKLGRIFGIPIGLHWSWFLVFLLVSWSLASSVLPRSLPGLSTVQIWGLGMFSALMLFTSVLAHELGHAWVALRNNIPVRRITLFIFGGVAQIGSEPDTPGKEFRITLAGPMVSLALAVLFGAISLLAPIALIAVPSRWLAEVNLTLALFNLLPGFPLDGGRILRSIIWAFTRSFEKATRAAGLVGRLVAFGFIGFGFIAMTNRDMANGLWMVFIGWFLAGAARAATQDPRIQQALIETRATELMDRRVAQVPLDLTLDSLVQQKIVTDGSRSFLVSERDRPVGLVTIRDIIAVPRADWPRTLVSQIMKPWDKLASIDADAMLSSALHSLEASSQAYAPVMVNNRMAGMLSREQILKYLRFRQKSSI